MVYLIEGIQIFIKLISDCQEFETNIFKNKVSITVH